MRELEAAMRGGNLMNDATIYGTKTKMIIGVAQEHLKPRAVQATKEWFLSQLNRERFEFD